VDTKGNAGRSSEGRREERQTAAMKRLSGSDGGNVEIAKETCRTQKQTWYASTVNCTTFGLGWGVQKPRRAGLGGTDIAKFINAFLSKTCTA
jgi:hypothetical protein